MNSERRHELQENELAAYVGLVNKTIEPYLKLIAVAVGVLALAVVGYAIWRSKTVGDRSDATLQLILATGGNDPEVYATVAQQYPSAAAGAWSRLYQGDQYLNQALNAVYEDQLEAADMFEQAASAYRQALAEGEHRVLRSRANLGLARVAESRGQIEEAIAAYEAVIATGESEQIVEHARTRIDLLSKPSTKKFLSWFSEQDFSPADPSLPPALPSGSMLPEMSDLDLPELDLSEDEEATAEDADTSAPMNDDAESGELSPSEPAEATEPGATEPTEAEPAETPEPTEATEPAGVTEVEPAESGEASESAEMTPNEPATPDSQAETDAPEEEPAPKEEAPERAENGEPAGNGAPAGNDEPAESAEPAASEDNNS